MDSLSDIAVFVRVVEAGSFTAAAEKLGLSQSAASKCVSRLEERLGTRLLNRSTRKLSLTESGSALYERGQRALAEIEDAELELARLQTEPRGQLRVSAPMSFAILHLAPVLGEFMSRYPALAVDLQLDDRLVDLVEEGFDCAIRIKALTDSSLIAKKIAPCNFVVCAAPEYLKRRGTPTRPEELREHDCIVYTYRDDPQDWEFRAPDGKRIKVPVDGRLRCNNGLIERAAVVAGLGIFVTPTFYVGDDLRTGRLVPILREYTVVPESNVYCVYPARRHLSPKVRVFVDFLAERFGPTPYWDVDWKKQAAP